MNDVAYLFFIEALGDAIKHLNTHIKEAGACAENERLSEKARLYFEGQVEEGKIGVKELLEIRRGL